MNIDNLNKLIAHLEARPPEQIDMRFSVYDVYPGCGACGCILGHANLIFDFDGDHLSRSRLASILGIDTRRAFDLTNPVDWEAGPELYPAHRVIATLKRLHDTYLATGQVVVDWGPEPGDESKTPWIAPQVAEVIAPALPAEITSLLRPSAVKTEA